MVRPSGIAVGVVNFDMGTVRSSILGGACAATGRSQRWCMLEWIMLSPENLRKFFVRMKDDQGFRNFYQNLFDLMRLVHLRIFDERAPEVELVSKALNEAVRLSLASEERGREVLLEQLKKRDERIDWLKGLTQDWEMKERTRWRDLVPEVMKTRTGVKRSRSQSKAKPGQTKRKRMRSRRAKLSVDAGAPQDLSCPAPSQLGLGLPGLESGFGAVDDGLEEVEVAGVPGGVPSGVPASDPGRPGPVVKPGPVKRMSAASRKSRKDAPRVLTYDKIIEGDNRSEAAFPDEMEFQFEIPPEERF